MNQRFTFAERDRRRARGAPEPMAPIDWQAELAQMERERSDDELPERFDRGARWERVAKTAGHVALILLCLFVLWLLWIETP